MRVRNAFKAKGIEMNPPLFSPRRDSLTFKRGVMFDVQQGRPPREVQLGSDYKYQLFSSPQYGRSAE